MELNSWSRGQLIDVECSSCRRKKRIDEEYIWWMWSSAHGYGVQLIGMEFRSLMLSSAHGGEVQLIELEFI